MRQDHGIEEHPFLVKSFSTFLVFKVFRNLLVVESCQIAFSFSKRTLFVRNCSEEACTTLKLFRTLSHKFVFDLAEKFQQGCQNNGLLFRRNIFRKSKSLENFVLSLSFGFLAEIFQKDCQICFLEENETHLKVFMYICGLFQTSFGNDFKMHFSCADDYIEENIAS